MLDLRVRKKERRAKNFKRHPPKSPLKLLVIPFSRPLCSIKNQKGNRTLEATIPRAELVREKERNV
jgi:hypothetical protein